MLRIRHKDLARLMGVSVGYSQQLIHRKGWRLKDEYLDRIVYWLAGRLKDGKGRTGGADNEKDDSRRTGGSFAKD